MADPGTRDGSSSANCPRKCATTRKDFPFALARCDYFRNFIDSWNFTSNFQKRIRGNLPSHKGWRLCLNAFHQLSEELLVKQKVMTFLYVRKLNQDHVEKLHCLIRGYNGFKDHPDLPAYVVARRCLAAGASTTELRNTSSPGANCEALSTRIVDCFPFSLVSEATHLERSRQTETTVHFTYEMLVEVVALKFAEYIASLAILRSYEFK
ncbi:hypothetical protein CAPTEDRAFT_204178 [Capitella teleta]|uniref:Uncharacterized protein n=1 Tax=Capitella teleta TaxID=283909 RepID=R7UIB7_CAPTE|nr:hypothetical protein CAPTEDRAFT_204178 [Capitella teleta]|eukprot:ELU06309.1 hypothetical protein CAPTEDRAFT_204178 [Capitella teleta]